MKKTETLLIRISSELKEILQHRSALLGMSPSEYIRFLVLEDSRKEMQ